jgi:hypothetical protein
MQVPRLKKIKRVLYLKPRRKKRKRKKKMRDVSAICQWQVRLHAKTSS